MESLEELLRASYRQDEQLAAAGSGGTRHRSRGMDQRRLCANPLMRLCEQLFENFSFLEVALQTKTATTNTTSTTPSPLTNNNKLPMTYKNFREYVLAWEPLIIEEFRANLVSRFIANVPCTLVTTGRTSNSVSANTNRSSSSGTGSGSYGKNSADKNSNRQGDVRAGNGNGNGTLVTGMAQFAIASVVREKTVTVEMIFHVPRRSRVNNKTKPRAVRGVGGSSYGRNDADVDEDDDDDNDDEGDDDHSGGLNNPRGLSVFDVVLLSASAINWSNICADGSHPPPATVLGMVIGIAPADPGGGGGGGGGRGRTRARTRKCYQLQINTAQWNKCQPSCTEVQVPTDLRKEVQRITSTHPDAILNPSNIIMNANAPHVTTLRTYRVHAIVIDNLRSNWREYLALHDLGENVHLLNELFATDAKPLSSQSVSTPAVVKEENGQSTSTTGAASTVKKEEATSTAVVAIDQSLRRLPGVTKEFMAHLHRQYNASQLQAIKAAALHSGFTLIQGPPGTGKTTTIIGLLNSIHIREYNRYYSHLLASFLGPQGLALRASMATRSPQQAELLWLELLSTVVRVKPRILVVAPSNVAVDHIAERILRDKGFLDGQLLHYLPRMIRIGRSSASSTTKETNGLIKGIQVDERVTRELSSFLTIPTLGGRQERLAHLNQEISELLKRLYHVQTILMNMIVAFAQACPLPKMWELRIHRHDAMPYWVNHRAKCVSHEPPYLNDIEIQRQMAADAAAAGGGGVNQFYQTVETLPEYLIYSHEFTSLIGKLDQSTTRRAYWEQALTVGVVDTHHRSSSTSASATTDCSQPLTHFPTLPMALRESIESALIHNAELLFTTLNSCGHKSMEGTEFCVTVVDEAAQCVEPSVLIALRRGCRQCVMVGDERQLTATVFSESAKLRGYDISLFERLIATGHEAFLLDTQYRMTPEISAFPSKMFYQSRLRDGSNVLADHYLPSYLRPNRLLLNGVDTVQPDLTVNAFANKPSPAILQPFMFFDLQSSRDVASSTSQSKVNEEEALLCMQLLQFVIDEAHKNTSPPPHKDQSKQRSLTIGIITPYSEQLTLLQRQFHRQRQQRQQRYFLDVRVELNTVDGFQGKEMDVIVMSTVRANEEKSIGFLSDHRRMNVALTRARFGLFVIGHSQTLVYNRYWRELIRWATHCRVLVAVPSAKSRLSEIVRTHQLQKGLATAPANGTATATTMVPSVLEENKKKRKREEPQDLEDGEVTEDEDDDENKLVFV